MSRVAILSAGPSLGQSIIRPGYDLTIGVNSAVEVFPCDWWCFADVATAIRVRPCVMTGSIFTSETEWSRLDGLAVWRKDELSGYQVEFFERVEIPGFVNSKWHTYSVTAALALAAHLGASEVDVYGHDMAGAVDHAGHDMRFTRTDARWEIEGRIWSLLCARLARDGVEVRRIAA